MPACLDVVIAHSVLDGLSSLAIENEAFNGVQPYCDVYLAATTVTTFGSNAFLPTMLGFLYASCVSTVLISPCAAVAAMSLAASTASVRGHAFTHLGASPRAANVCLQTCGFNTTCTVNGIITSQTVYQCAPALA